MSSDQISDEAWERAAFKKLDLTLKAVTEGRLAQVLTSGKVLIGDEDALAAQAEIDRANEVSDAMVDAYERVNGCGPQLYNNKPSYRRARKKRFRGIEAALKAKAR